MSFLKFLSFTFRKCSMVHQDNIEDQLLKVPDSSLGHFRRSSFKMAQWVIRELLSMCYLFMKAPNGVSSHCQTFECQIFGMALWLIKPLSNFCCENHWTTPNYSSGGFQSSTNTYFETY
jgi:hypothetical protein